VAKYRIEDVIAALEQSKGMIYVAARKMGCSPQTIYNYAKRYPTVQQAIDCERGLMVDNAELALWKAIQNGEGWAISLTLKTIGKERGYVERQEWTGKDGDPIQAAVKIYIPANGRDVESPGG
jgi:hypothetical protein